MRGARKGLVPFVVGVVVVALAAPALAGPVASDQDRYRRRPAEVKISRDVRLGQFSEIGVRVWARCRSPWVVQELLIDVSQGDASGSYTRDFGIVCNGTWQPIRTSVSTSGGGPFAPGLTTVNATLTVIDPVTGDPAPQGQDSVTVFVHGQAEVKISKDVRLGQGDAMLVTVWVRCERPWVPQPLSVGVSQAEGTIFGSASGDFGIVCDDRWHRVDVQVFGSGDGFGRGLTTVDASLSVLDPIDFDPVDQGTDSVTVWVNAAADVKIAEHARLDVNGSLSLPVWVRCQRPWVVAGLSVDASQESGTGGSASGNFGVVCDGRWHRVEVSIDPSPGPFQGEILVQAFFTVLDPDSFDPVEQAQDTAVVDTPFSSSSTNCLEPSGTTFISTWVWETSGSRLDQVQVESGCAATYTFVTLDFEVNVVVAPGASAIWGPAELTLFGKFLEPSVHVAQGTDIPGASTPCVYTAIADIDYLLEADGTLVPDPCPDAAT